MTASPAEVAPEPVADAAVRAIRRALGVLTFREREIVKMYYGVDEPYGVLTPKEIGRVFGISPARVGQIRRMAERKLRRRVQVEGA